MSVTAPPLLEIQDLRVSFPSPHGTVSAVRGVCIEIAPGEVVGVVGESGSGKSVTALSALDLVPRPGTVTDGRFIWRGEVLGEGGLRGLRGREISMIFQDPLSSLNPVVPVGRQISDVVRRHTGRSKTAAAARAEELLARCGLPDARRCAASYPFELSGGMAQRAMVAMALASEPALLIADEPTSALDVTVQAQVLDLLLEVRDSMGVAILLITHDLGVVAAVCDRVAVMYGGTVVESGKVREILARPRHPYTAGLLASSPRLDRPLSGFTRIAGAMVPAASAGCVFAGRCDRSTEGCIVDIPPLVVDGSTTVACWHPLNTKAKP